jgi:hypothetical protein
VAGAKLDYQRFGRLYAAAFLAELRARWPVDVIERVVKRRPWLVGGPSTWRAASPTSRPD